jgi:hypothetical protein
MTGVRRLERELGGNSLRDSSGPVQRFTTAVRDRDDQDMVGELLVTDLVRESIRNHALNWRRHVARDSRPQGPNLWRLRNDVEPAVDLFQESVAQTAALVVVPSGVLKELLFGFGMKLNAEHDAL